jgi:lipopolysaccharide biosynthesis protein
MNLLNQIQMNVEPNLEYEPDSADVALPNVAPVRLIAYYLPQFHPIPENNQWWGEGFTEWTNVTRALPRYIGHYQPRLPGGLGFYDLRLTDSLRLQTRLAKRYGISSFCFHFYWFNGRRLLDTPLQLLLSHPDIDFSFCINWANEPWTRSWNGANKRILIAQNHSAEDDLAFASAIEPALRDPRYTRVKDRPLIMLYRPGLLPDAGATVMRWRKYFMDRGLGDPYVVMPQAFGDNDPRKYGMDAAAGFPPHPYGWDLPPVQDLVLLDPSFYGRVMSYDALIDAALAVRAEEFTYFPGVCPAWDNEARRPRRGMGYLGASPNKYGSWLEQACHKAAEAPDPGERVVFVNAWNEWAEGAYLEPDRHYGYAYLRQTASALSRFNSPMTKSRLGSAMTEARSSRTTSSPKWARTVIRRARRRGADAIEILAQAIRPGL